MGTDRTEGRGRGRKGRPYGGLRGGRGFTGVRAWAQLSTVNMYVTAAAPTCPVSGLGRGGSGQSRGTRGGGRGAWKTDRKGHGAWSEERGPECGPPSVNGTVQGESRDCSKPRVP